MQPTSRLISSNHFSHTKAFFTLKSQATRSFETSVYLQLESQHSEDTHMIYTPSEEVHQ